MFSSHLEWQKFIRQHLPFNITVDCRSTGRTPTNHPRAIGCRSINSRTMVHWSSNQPPAKRITCKESCCDAILILECKSLSCSHETAGENYSIHDAITIWELCLSRKEFSLGGSRNSGSARDTLAEIRIQLPNYAQKDENQSGCDTFTKKKGGGEGLGRRETKGDK